MKPLRRRHPHPEIPLVSTADVSFLLLIFFLATTVFQVEAGSSSDSRFRARPPSSRAPTASPGSRWAKIARSSSTAKPVALGSLKEALRLRLGREPRTLVTVEVHPRAPYDALVQTLDQVKLSGVREIALRTAEGA
jgi:biopolymer transport protein ExbD